MSDNPSCDPPSHIYIPLTAHKVQRKENSRMGGCAPTSKTFQKNTIGLTDPDTDGAKPMGKKPDHAHPRYFQLIANPLSACTTCYSVSND